MRLFIVLLLLNLSLSACSSKPKTFDSLNISEGESGPVPASTIANLPAAEAQVVYTRESDGVITAVYRKTVPCPSQMINSVTSIAVKPDKILLCFKPIEATSPEAKPLSVCPYELAIKHQILGIPKEIEPKFEVSDNCA